MSIKLVKKARSESMQTNPKRSLTTQTNILHAATRLTKMNGWESTTIRSICTEAGVSIGAFYHHFASKQELINHAFILFDATLNENLPNDDVPPLEAMKNVLMVQTAFIVREAGSLIIEYYKNILTDEDRSAADPDRLYYKRVLMHARQAETAGQLRSEFTPQYVTELLIKFVRGCIIDWCLHNYKYDVVARTDTELDLLIGALRKQ